MSSREQELIDVGFVLVCTYFPGQVIQEGITVGMKAKVYQKGEDVVWLACPEEDDEPA